MEKQITYIAFDGQEFEDEKECEAYEDAVMHLKGVIGFDGHYRVVDSAEAVATDARYYFITNAEDARQTLDFLYEYYGTEMPKQMCDGDFLRYDEDEDCWINMIDEFRCLGDVISTMAKHVKESAKHDESMKDAWYNVQDQLAHCLNVVAIAYTE